MLGGVRVRLVTSDEQLALRGPALRKAILADIEEGNIPFYVSLENEWLSLQVRGFNTDLSF